MLTFLSFYWIHLWLPGCVTAPQGDIWQSKGAIWIFCQKEGAAGSSMAGGSGGRETAVTESQEPVVDLERDWQDDPPPVAVAVDPVDVPGPNLPVSSRFLDSLSDKEQSASCSITVSVEAEFLTKKISRKHFAWKKQCH
ncbi:uncharacterized protein LOC129334764 isoform X3 [Eublepharis macularius]|uniref:Uncharacterized protein LOC129334764 isoform X3 n=1 Tax=Eublepharis macularius TaxID=481883 RepID=A0AA97L819_EUBMA|nr:uncharacterized protein LOC129334764 isoform X3 [Eublepharis macularius]